MKFFRYAFLALFSAGLMSCGGSSDDDSEKPTVTITSPTGSAVSGSDITVTFSATDNEELDTYTVSISKNTTQAIVKSVDGTFPAGGSSVTEDKDGNALPSINGQTTKSVSFVLSTETGDNQVASPGTYTISINVTDASGNSNVASGTFDLTNPNA